MTNNSDDMGEVQRRLREIRDHKRGAVRWTASSHTAELAIGAIERGEHRKPSPRTGKSRRRKRRKRLL